MSAGARKILSDLVAEYGEDTVRKFMRSKGLSGTTVDDKAMNQIKRELASQPMRTDTPANRAYDVTPYNELKLDADRFPSSNKVLEPEFTGFPGEKSFRNAVDEASDGSGTRFPTKKALATGAAAGGIGAGALAGMGLQKPLADKEKGDAFINMITADKTIMDSVEETPKADPSKDDPIKDDSDPLAELKKQVKGIQDPKKVKLVSAFSEDMDMATKKAREFIKSFEAEENKLALREVIEKVTQAAAQMGAAIAAGDKYDASGLKFSSSDWEKKADRLNDKFNKAVALLDSNDKAARRDLEKQAELDAKYEDDLQRARQARIAGEATITQLEQRERESRANQTLAAAEISRKVKEAQAKLMAKAEGLGAAKSEKLQKELRDILQDTKTSDSQKKSAIKNIAVTGLGLSKEDADKLAGRTGWFGTSSEEFVEKLTGVLDRASPGGKVIAPPPPAAGAVRIRHKNGNIYELTPEKLQKLNPSDYTRL